MKICGIYKITNLTNKKVYVGQSRNCKKRIKNHINKLNKNKHQNIYLQSSWNKYGEKSFILELIEECPNEELTIRENYWMNIYNSFKREKGYNLLSPSKNKDSYIFPKEVREMMSKSMTVYTDEELIRYLIHFYNENKRVPNQRDFSLNKEYPNYGTYHNRFGSFKEALMISGLYDLIVDKHNFEKIKIKDYDKNIVIKEVTKFIKENNKPINTKEIERNKNIPSSSSIFKMFGTLEKLMEECGYSKQYFAEIENREAIKGLKKLYLKDGWITRAEIDKQIYTRSSSFYIKRFGKLSNAYKMAGIPLSEHGHPQRFILK